MIDKWEYKQVMMVNQDADGQPRDWSEEMNFWGNGGWECYAVVPVHTSDGRVHRTTAMFKRRVDPDDATL